MNSRPFLLGCLITVTNTFAAEAPKHPAIPEQPIAKKKDLLFADDFEKAELGSAWKILAPTLSIVKCALRGTRMRCVPALAAGTLASL